MPPAAPYQDLGPFPMTAVSDPQAIPPSPGANPFGAGYYTCTFVADDIMHAQPLAEIYHMSVVTLDAPAFQIFRGNAFWDYVLVGNNAWDPSIPMPMRSGDTVYIYFKQPPSITPAPQVTLWVRIPYSYYS